MTLKWATRGTISQDYSDDYSDEAHVIKGKKKQEPEEDKPIKKRYNDSEEVQKKKNKSVHSSDE
jgi:hypothetical protein